MTTAYLTNVRDAGYHYPLCTIKMNKIEATYEKSEYVNEPHLVLKVDGITLDEIVHKEYPDQMYKGLVPTLLDWLEDTKERKVVWERVQSESKSVVPILMCPDDIDLWCTILNVEVQKSDKTVKWNKIGIDKGNSENMPYSIGTNVEWFENIPNFEFNREEYEQSIGIFKEEIDKDEIKKLIKFWVHRIEDAENFNKNVIAFNFGIIESEKDYKLYLTGCNEYDANNDDWACNIDFEPKEKYLSLGEDSKRRNWEEIQSIVKLSVEEFIKTRISPITFLHTAKYITTGFDNGELIKIEKSA